MTAEFPPEDWPPPKYTVEEKRARRARLDREALVAFGWLPPKIDMVRCIPNMSHIIDLNRKRKP